MIRSTLIHNSVLLLNGLLDQFKKHGMNRTQLQDSVRKQAASSQRPCYTVYQRTVKQMAPLDIWVILILPFILSFC